MLKTLACALAVTAALPAAAAPLTESRVVRYDDLNLSSRAGIERLERRIDAAARSACGVTARLTSPGEFANTRACLAASKARAAQQVAALGRANARGG